MWLHEHCRRSKNLFGKPFQELHQFLDQYMPIYGTGDHRRFLHHKKGVELCAELFGEEARKHAVQHVKDDLKGNLPNDWTYFEDDFMPEGEELAEWNAELKKLYGGN